jgi:hypothetical protein
MGRPLNKKFFGNRNIGRNGREGTTKQYGLNRSHYSQGEGTMHSVPAGDDGIGGEGLASVNFGAGNRGAYLARIPSVTSVDKPTLPGGVQAIGSVTHVQAVSAQLWDEGQGYNVGDIFTTTGTGTTATFRVTSLRVQGFTVANPTAAGNTAYDLVNVVALDNSNSNGGNSANWASPFVIKPITVGTGGNSTKLSGGTVAQSGRWTGTGTPPASFTLTADNTRGTTGPGAGFGLPNYGGTGDCNAAGAILNITWGIGDFELVTDGDYTAVPAAHTSVVRVSGATPTQAAQLDVFYGVKTVAFSERGSGYTGVEAVAFSTVTGDEVRAVGAVVLTVDTGFVGSATNQENAIIARVYYDDQVQIADIIKQQNARSYVVIVQSEPTDPENTDKDDEPVLARLVARVPQDIGESAPAKEMTIRATDDNGNTYFVTKLTAHKARVVRDTQNMQEEWLFANGESARWTFGNAQAGDRKSVQIENA